MIHVRMDSKQVNRVLNNAVSYSYGFLQGIDLDQIVFNKMLAEYTIEALEKFIDSNARANPDALHHVYEWGQTGGAGARLFEFKSKVSKRVIHIHGKFLKSKSVSDTSDTPFTNKAQVMEDGISIVIEPTNADVLVFEDEGELVFTANSVYIEHPGGDAVAGSFGATVDEFFGSYFNYALLMPFIKELSTADEYTKSFAAGTRGGRSVGIMAGRKYITSAGGAVA